MVVESVGSPREGHQVATLRTLDGGASGFRLAADAAALPADRARRPRRGRRRARQRPDSPYGAYLDRLGAWGTLDARILRLLDRPPTRYAARIAPARRGDLLTRVLPEPEAGLAAGHPHRAARPGRPGRRGQPSRRPASATSSRSPAGTSRSSPRRSRHVPAASVGGGAPSSRASRSSPTSLRGCVAVGAARRRDGRRGAARPRDRPGRSSGGGARLGRDAPAPRRSAADRRRRLPALEPWRPPG